MKKLEVLRAQLHAYIDECIDACMEEAVVDSVTDVYCTPAELVLDFVRKSCSTPYVELGSDFRRGCKLEAHLDGVIPLGAICRALSRNKAFRHETQTGSVMVLRTLNTLTEKGVLQRLSRGEMSDKYGARSLGFKLI